MESLLSSAPPGQLDNLIDEISTLTTISPDLVDKMKANAKVSSEISLQHPLAPALEQELKLYQKEYYSQADFTFSITDDLNVSTYSERIDIKNCYAGSWRGDWKITIVNEPTTSATLQGTIRIRVYCHEDCNVQLETIKVYDDPIVVVVSAGGDDDKYSTLAKSIRSKIATLESDVSAELDEMYTSMDDKLKALRRVLPVMRTRLEWNVLAHRMVKKLEASSTTTSS
ncbi:hypothetical protein MHU86_16623 [Fragilaria crotonensis]|nr:hypothetical protein MHU86_16623 [Fragilaria crotonensis]